MKIKPRLNIIIKNLSASIMMRFSTFRKLAIREKRTCPNKIKLKYNAGNCTNEKESKLIEALANVNYFEY